MKVNAHDTVVVNARLRNCAFARDHEMAPALHPYEPEILARMLYGEYLAA